MDDFKVGVARTPSRACISDATLSDVPPFHLSSSLPEECAGRRPRAADFICSAFIHDLPVCSPLVCVPNDSQEGWSEAPRPGACPGDGSQQEREEEEGPQ